MKAIGKMSSVELAAFVQTRLKEKGIDVVLSGGASVCFYSSGKYVSGDVDLVNAHFIGRRKLSEAMRELGFNEEGRHFTHPDTDLFVEFPPGPLAVGGEPVAHIQEHKLSTGILRVISPTDCIKDRLAAYFHWDDAQSLEQAVLVAQANKINLNEIERWAKTEGKLPVFNNIKNRLKNGRYAAAYGKKK